MPVRKATTRVGHVGVVAVTSAAGSITALVAAAFTGGWYLVAFAGVATFIGSVSGTILARLDFLRAGFEQRYLQQVAQLCRPSGTLTPSGSKPKALDPLTYPVFIDVRLREAGRSKPRPITSWLSSSKPAVLTLVGGPGSGKSTLLRHIALQAAEGERKSPRSLPILLSLPDCAADIAASVELSLPEAVHASLGELQGRGRADWFEQQLHDGRCLVLLDALDEVPDRYRPAVSDWVQQQVMRNPGNDFVVASRNLPPGKWPSPDARTLHLQPLTDSQIADYMERQLLSGLTLVSAVENLTRGKTLEQMRERSDLLEFARTPLLLALLTNTYRFTGRLPVNRTVLYGELVEHQLSRRAPRSDDELSPEQKLRIVRVLALAMTQDGRETAPEDWCTLTIERSLRRSGPVSPARFLRLIVDDGVLVQGPGHTYMFAHREFQRYLTAAQIGAEGSVRLLIDRVEDPRWHDIILTWASSADASPVIEACLRRGSDAMLSLALDCAAVSPQIDPELRSDLQGLRRRRRTVEPGKDALTTYVEEQYSTAAAQLLPRFRERGHRVGRREIDELLARPQSRPASDWTEADASAFLSAAVLATEVAWHREASGYRFKGLIALAYALRERSRSSSRDLCLAALRQLDQNGPQPADVLLACLAYLGSTVPQDGTDEFVRALRSACRAAGNRAGELLVPLVAAHQEAARLVVDAVRGDEELTGRMSELLGTDPAGSTTLAGWEPAVERWHRARRELVHQFCELAQLTVDEESLLQARERMAEGLQQQSAGVLGLKKLSQALDRLDHFLRNEQFDERDTALRAAERYAAAVRDGVRSAPTSLSVELSEPAAVRIEELVQEERRRLAQRHPPHPGLVAALPTARIRGRTLTVAVEVANQDVRSAPIESAWLTATGDPAVLTPQDGPTEVPDPVRGGTATTVLLRLTLAEAALDSERVEMDLELRYRRRDQPDDAVLRGRLTVRVDRTHAPIEPNPFMAGNSGLPVGDPDMFFGQKELIDRVLERLRGTSEPGAGIALFGQKRTGKSSIRVELIRRLRAADGLPVADVGNLGELTPQRHNETDTGTLLGSLLWRILDRADKSIASGIRLIPDGFDRDALIKSPDPVEDCAALFDRYRTACPDGLPWVVLIDEFQYMDQWIREGLVGPSFMQTFKAIVERRLFHLVLVGQTRLERLVEEDPNAFGVFYLERVTCLAEPDARALIQEPVMLATPEGRVSRYHERAVEEILRLSGGNPYYIQKICFALVAFMNGECATSVTDADVREVTRSMLNGLRGEQFDGLEAPDFGDDRWTAEELRAALVALSCACSTGLASREAIERCHQRPLAAGLLEHLVSRDVVRQVGDRYQFVVGLYEEWLRRYFVAPEGQL
ncbi:NACHT domain-containing protein [Streptomyces sp. M41]|uniref:NACHT domain-containing protein n=1 Tax=Streptomyces sp. M41 TaxID=3059412 RepID=UPI00374D12C9